MGSMSFGDFVRTATRPTLTITALIAWIAFIEAKVDYPPAFQWLTIVMSLEWFGERALGRFAQAMKGKT